MPLHLTQKVNKKETYNKVINIYLLRGLIREAAHWGNFEKYIKKHIPKARVYYLEKPGTGAFHKDDCPSNITEITIATRKQFILQNKKNTKVVNMIMAGSMGAMVTAEWLRIYPEDFQKAVLVNTSFKNTSKLFDRLKPAAILMFTKSLFEKDLAKRERMILETVSNHAKEQPNIHENWVNIQKLRPISRKTALNQILASSKFQMKLKKPQADILIAASKKDKLAHYRCSENIAKLWNSPMILHETAGHELFLDAPDWLLANVVNWLKNQRA